MEMGKLSSLIYSILFMCLSVFLFGCQSNYFEKELPQILGIDEVEITNTQIFDEWAGIQGDGYILEIYELSEGTVQSFLSSPKELPEKNLSNCFGWDKSPVDSSYDEIMILGLNYFSDNQELKKLLIEIKQLLKQKEVYYSFYYRPNKDNPNSVQIFILNIESRKLYAIDQQL